MKHNIDAKWRWVVGGSVDRFRCVQYRFESYDDWRTKDWKGFKEAILSDVIEVLYRRGIEESLNISPMITCSPYKMRLPNEFLGSYAATLC
jgi:hypothetical protein